MALFHTTVLDNQIKALSTIGSASGSIATFETDKAERLVNLEVAIVATGGGGTPVSPIAINGFSACNLSVNGTTETIPFGQTIYGGSLNVGSGVLTVTYADIDMGTINYQYVSPLATQGIFPFGLTGKKLNGDYKSEQYATLNNQSAWLPQDDFSIISVTGISDIRIKNTNCMTVAQIQSATSGCRLIYELATPLTLQLDSKQIQAIIGTNNIYADTGDIIDLKFVLSVGKAIS